MTRRPTRTVQATWLTMLALQTIGTIDANRKMPAPKQYVVTTVLWGIMFLVADTNDGEAAKVAARLSILVLLTSAVLGPFGARFVTFLEMVAKTFAATPPGAGAGTAGTSTTTPGSQTQAVSAPAQTTPYPVTATYF